MWKPSCCSCVSFERILVEFFHCNTIVEFVAMIHNWCCSNCTKPRCCRTDGCTILSLVKVLHSGIPGKRENPQVALERVFPASILLTILFQHNYVPEVLKDLWYLHQSSFAHRGEIYIEFLVFQRLSSLLLEMGSYGCYRLLQVSWRTTKGIIYNKSTLTPVGIFLLWYSPTKNPIFCCSLKLVICNRCSRQADWCKGIHLLC